ncbi:MAG: UDP-glucose--hexose-1-phosphate uridylyltransferase [Gammaproteobacteria bacterium]|nr:UDP-glucose--hexose-1-phosphate uridylyltransferase [Gammaproteobacteria bacterium]
MSATDRSHARRNPLTREWVLVSPQRLQRPWQGQLEEPEAERLPDYDTECYLCPGNRRANGNMNPDYAGPYAFDNDFPALSAQSEIDATEHALFETRAEAGCCRVVCYTERHDLRLATMSARQRVVALSALIDEFVALDRRSDIGYVQVFENRGAMMGCSNPHPHAQIWATTNVPTEPAKELQSQADYLETSGASLLIDYLAAELADGARVIAGNEHFVAVVPFWAVWPFETLLLPRRRVAGPEELGSEELAALAETLATVLNAYERMFDVAVPYSLGWHARPSDGKPHPEWQLHVHIYPPLLRSASIRKHLVGYEMLGMPQRDLTPEEAAARLRAATRDYE